MKRKKGDEWLDEWKREVVGEKTVLQKDVLRIQGEYECENG